MNTSPIIIKNINKYHRTISNNELILTLKISNISNYTQTINNDELKLTPIYNYITLEIFNNLNLTNSKIDYCIIKELNNNVISYNQQNWFQILIDIYKSIPATLILQTSSFNIKLTNENGIKGYRWCPEINMSIQCKNTNETYKEIMKIIIIKNYKIDIGITLLNNYSVNYKN